MTKVKGINHYTLEELNFLIEQKTLKILGDPDYGLKLREEFKQEILKRIRLKHETIPHEEVVKLNNNRQ